jgi:transcriptional regulator with XRE-family HTH domain
MNPFPAIRGVSSARNCEPPGSGAGLTQAEVAEQAGLTQQYVSVVEGGRQNITLSTMIALARVTGHEVRVVLRRVRRQPE